MIIKKRLTIFLLIGLLTACTGAPATSAPTEQPASTPTEVPASATPTVVVADTATVTVPTVPATEAPAQVATVSFANDVLPILQSRCLNCHGGQRTEENLDVSSYAALMAGNSTHGPAILPGNADASLLIELIVSQEMPKRGPKLTPPQVQTLIDWINQGALDN